MARRSARKHGKVKDPYKQMEAREAKIRHKVNRKPANEERQEISRKQQEIADFQKKNLLSKAEIRQNAKESKIQRMIKMKMKRKLKKEGGGLELIDTASLIQMERRQPGMERPLKMIPRLKQFSNESDETFYKRVCRASQVMISESKFEAKFKVDIERHESGDIKHVKRRKLVDDPLIPEKLRGELQEKDKIRKEKKKERDYRRKYKNRKKENDDEFLYFQDKVKFGEVVYEPPSLDASNLKKITKGVTKTKSFLFMEKIKGSQAEKIPELTASRKRTLEEERLKAVQAYRDMKAAKYKTQNMNLSFG